MGVVSALMWVQWYMERRGDCYVAKTRVRTVVGEERVEDWKSEKTFVEGLKTSRYFGGRTEPEVDGICERCL